MIVLTLLYVQLVVALVAAYTSPQRLGCNKDSSASAEDNKKNASSPTEHQERYQ